MRESLASSRADEKLAYVRTVPGRPTDSREKLVVSPKKSARTPAAPPLKMAWADTYSGCAGVGSNGVQAGSAAVSGLPSASASTRAVIGRQVRSVQDHLGSPAATLSAARARFINCESPTR